MTGWRTQWSEDHGEDGLRDKFTVVHNNSGETISGTDELVVVLRPESDRSACEALKVYALIASRRAPKFAEELHRRLREIEKRNRRARIDAYDPHEPS